jgi:signal transduction histidine kinase
VRNLSWLIRVVALVVVGVSTLTIPASNTRNLVIDIIAFVVATLGVALWTATDCSPAYRARFAGLLPYAAAATTLTCSWAALSNNGGPFILLSSMALVWAGNALSLRAAGAITALGVIAIVSVPLVFSVSTWDWLGLPVVLLLSLVFGRLLRSYRVQAEQSDVLLAKSEQLRHEQSRAATLDERNRIAREIHDVLAHSLGALSVQIQAARAVLTDQRDVDRAVDLLGQAQRMATEGLVETRRALQALRTDTPPLPDGLAELSAVHQLRYRAPVSFEVTGAPRQLSPDAGLALTRTAQEALVNTAKYAPHQPVEVRLEFGERYTALSVANRLCQQTAKDNLVLETANGGYGLAGMRERLLLMRGSLSAGPLDDSWVVTAQVPQ